MNLRKYLVLLVVIILLPLGWYLITLGMCFLVNYFFPKEPYHFVKVEISCPDGRKMVRVVEEKRVKDNIWMKDFIRYTCEIRPTAHN